MRVGSGPGLGWPEEISAAGEASAAEEPGDASGGPLDGLGWPKAAANGSDGPGGSEGTLRPARTAEAWAEYVSRPRGSGAGQAAMTTEGGRVAEVPARAGGPDEADDPGGQPPERVRRALAPVSRETGPGGVIQSGSLNVTVASASVPADDRAAAGERPPDGAAGVRATTGLGSVGGAEDTGAGESEVEVAIPAGPDAVADTPIARAAQAAVVARAGGTPWPRPSSCRIITIANQKGGVGKTTTAVNMAASLAMHGARVLVVDLDPQGNASTALDVDHHSGIASVYNVLVDGQPLGSVIKQVSGFPQLYCAPAAIDLAGAEIELVPLVARESRLSRALSAYDASNLDYIFIDCPPSLGLLTVNALVAAPEVLIPIQCEYYALEGLEQLLRTVDLVRSHLNPGLSVTTILLTMYDGRTRLASQVADEVREHFGAVVLASVIPRSVRVSEAPSYGQSVMTYDPGSTGALAYLEAARELAQRNAAPAAS